MGNYHTKEEKIRKRKIKITHQEMGSGLALATIKSLSPENKYDKGDTNRVSKSTLNLNSNTSPQKPKEKLNKDLDSLNTFGTGIGQPQLEKVVERNSVVTSIVTNPDLPPP